MGFVDPEVARAEPRLYELVARETAVPVPEVYGFVDDHAEYPSPFYLLERLDGENYEFDRVGSVGVRDGDLTVVPNGEGGPYDDDGRAWFRDAIENTLDALTEGTYFPEMADEPERFADLVPTIRAAFDERIAAMPDPDPPRLCHCDYRWRDLLLDPATGETRAVLDWANCSTTRSTRA